MIVDRTPEHAALLRDFVNTYDYETAENELTDPGSLTGWLRSHTLLSAGARASARDLSTALELRAGLHAAMSAHHDGDPGPSARLDAVARRLTVRVDFSVPQPRLAPVGSGVPAALARVLVAAAQASVDGSWARLKVCPAEDCRWAFYDQSKNRSRTWCAMRVCGNREKTRGYRSRRREEGG